MVYGLGLKKIPWFSGKINIGKKHSLGMFQISDIYLLHTWYFKKIYFLYTKPRMTHLKLIK